MGFELLGHFMEFYKGKKYFGQINCLFVDRTEYGYTGAKTEVVDSDIYFKRGIIKKGTEVTTVIYPLTGKFTK